MVDDFCTVMPQRVRSRSSGKTPPRFIGKDAISQDGFFFKEWE